MSTATSGDVGPGYYVVGTSEVHERSVSAFRDEVDAAVDRYLAEAGKSRKGSIRPLVFDLGWVTFLDGVGVQVLIEATDRVEAAGGALRFRNAAGAIRLALEGAGRWAEVHGPKPATQGALTVTRVTKPAAPAKGTAKPPSPTPKGPPPPPQRTSGGPKPSVSGPPARKARRPAP